MKFKSRKVDKSKTIVTQDAAVFGKPEPTVQELVTACVVRKENAEVGFNFLKIQ